MDVTGATSAIPCAVGTFQALSGQSSCDLAPAGKYVDTTGAIAATSCPSGTWSYSAGSISVSACVDAPFLTISGDFYSAGTVNFGNELVGSTKGTTLTLTNSGLFDLNITDILIGGTNFSDFSLNLGASGNFCGSTSLVLAPGNSCDVGMDFSPSAMGYRTATLDFSHDSPLPTQIILDGDSTYAPVIEVPSTNVVLSNTVTSTTVTIRNTGGDNLLLGDIALANPLEYPFSLDSSACTGLSINPSASCSLTISYVGDLAGWSKSNNAYWVTLRETQYGFMLIGTLLTTGLFIRRKKYLLLIVMVVSIASLNSCGGGSDSNPGSDLVTDSFDIPSNDPVNGSVTVLVSYRP
ncbi:MAG: choice-of-anchor D domain-containing protein [Gammaproteobacteria bacterium]|nr:choice-of-anchor D domain-containing protein [Gammaproteobacteria bacterium]